MRRNHAFLTFLLPIGVIAFIIVVLVALTFSRNTCYGDFLRFRTGFPTLSADTLPHGGTVRPPSVPLMLPPSVSAGNGRRKSRLCSNYGRDNDRLEVLSCPLTAA